VGVDVEVGTTVVVLLETVTEEPLRVVRVGIFDTDSAVKVKRQRGRWDGSQHSELVIGS
jgi:hypothetical protein